MGVVVLKLCALGFLLPLSTYVTFGEFPCEDCFRQWKLCELCQCLYTPNFYCPPQGVLVFYLKIILEVEPLYLRLVLLWAPLLRPNPKFSQKTYSLSVAAIFFTLGGLD